MYIRCLLDVYMLKFSILQKVPKTPKAPAGFEQIATRFISLTIMPPADYCQLYHEL